MSVKMPGSDRLLLAAFQLIVVMAGFLLMLLVMSFNVWVFFTVIIGLVVGKMITNSMQVPDLTRIGKLAADCTIY